MNPFKPHIVKFEENLYAIRRLRFGWEYKDLVYLEFWWSRNSKYFVDCVGDKSKVRYFYNIYHKKGKRL